MIVCPECGKPTRVKHNLVDGKNVRVCKCGAVLDKKYEKVAKKKATKTTKKVAEAKDETKATKKTKLEKVEKTTRASSTKNKAESANVKRKQDM